VHFSFHQFFVEYTISSGWNTGLTPAMAKPAYTTIVNQLELQGALCNSRPGARFYRAGPVTTLTCRLKQPQQEGYSFMMQLPANPLFINLGVPELSIIVVLVLILFGPGKLPHVMKSLGDGVKQFKDAASGSDKAERKTEEAE
jgi:sec-independent protein translocase protein TatA